MNAVHDAERLKELQSLPLDRKIQISQTRIIEWYQHYQGNVVVSFSGGKDSTVLLHLVRRLYPDVRAVFSNTGLEYPEIQKFVKSFDNVDIVTPSMRFDQVVSTYGYPLISKEVAEAIYYARRIRSQSSNVERERERAAQGQSPNPKASKQLHQFIETSTARNRRTVLSGKMSGPNGQALGNGRKLTERESPLETEWKRLEIGGGRINNISRAVYRRQTAGGAIFTGNGKRETSWSGNAESPG